MVPLGTQCADTSGKPCRCTGDVWNVTQERTHEHIYPLWFNFQGLSKFSERMHQQCLCKSVHISFEWGWLKNLFVLDQCLCIHVIHVAYSPEQQKHLQKGWKICWHPKHAKIWRNLNKGRQSWIQSPKLPEQHTYIYMYVHWLAQTFSHHSSYLIPNILLRENLSGF